MRSLIAPKTARAARLYRLAKGLAKQPGSSVPRSEGELMVWVQSHMRKDADVRLSLEEEALREAKVPLEMSDTNFATSNQVGQGSMFHLREYPMYPGEYVPPEHNALASVRDDLRMDLAAQSLKDAWMRVSGGTFFRTSDDYYARVEGLDEQQIGEIVAAVLPGFNRGESSELVSRLLETLSRPDNSPTRQLNRTVTAEALGLDKAPGHYSNFLEWMGRITETKAFSTEHALFQFTRRKFNKQDVRMMNENYKLLGKVALNKEAADGYSHFYSVLKDFAVKHAGSDTRHQVGVRIDPQEFDPETGIAVGSGFSFDRTVIAYVRENRDRTGRAFFMGKTLAEAFDHRPWVLEAVLWPLDEAGLDFRDFDIYFVNEGVQLPFMGDRKTGVACRLALSNAIAKLVPLVRPALKKAGLLSVDRTQAPAHHPGFIDGGRKRRAFAKR